MFLAYNKCIAEELGVGRDAILRKKNYISLCPFKHM